MNPHGASARTTSATNLSKCYELEHEQNANIPATPTPTSRELPHATGSRPPGSSCTSDALNCAILASVVIFLRAPGLPLFLSYRNSRSCKLVPFVHEHPKERHVWGGEVVRGRKSRLQSRGTVRPFQFASSSSCDGPGPSVTHRNEELQHLAFRRTRSDVSAGIRKSVRQICLR